MQKGNPKKQIRKPQQQPKPGEELKMKPQPVSDKPEQPGTGKLQNKIALITGGDSGIGRAVAILFAKEGADVAISYLNEHEDANDTRNIIETEYGRTCLLLPSDVSKEKTCISIVNKTIKKFNRIDIFVNNAAMHYESKSLEDITTEHLLNTFYTNIISMFWITKAALPYIKKGSSIINTSSVTAYRGSAAWWIMLQQKGQCFFYTQPFCQTC